MNVIEATGLGKRYWATWALRDCTLAIPPGRVAALVGPNGAGKTTLMHLAVGLTAPSQGQVTVLGGRPAGSPGALSRVAFVAQDVPLYRHLRVKDMVHLARNLNGPRWDQPRADQRLAALNIPPRRKVGKLSGGQQAQVALTIALARRPEFLVLDEPLAPLDPLARHEFLASVMESVAEDGTSVLFSSHVLAELERIADYLVVLAGGRVQVAGDVDTLLAGHQILTGPAAVPPGAQFDVVYAQQGSAQAHLLVRQRAAAAQPPGSWQAHPVTLEELVLAYLREPGASALPGPEPLAAGAVTGATT
ncbi:MAG: ABC transporter ATP-binding protein [Actinomycetota bacterium]|nr:ABC transporter ATP-binding protein [Actinomycetota bacterium]